MKVSLQPNLGEKKEEAMRCAALTHSGKPCSRQATAGSAYCKQHAEKRIPAEEPSPQPCVFPPWIRVPHPNTGHFDSLNTHNGQDNLNAIRTALQDEKKQYGLYTFRSVFRHIPPTQRDRSTQGHRFLAFHVLMASLFAPTAWNCVPHRTFLQTCMLTNETGAWVDLPETQRLQDLAYNQHMHRQDRELELQHEAANARHTAIRKQDQQLLAQGDRNGMLALQDEVDRLAQEDEQTFQRWREAHRRVYTLPADYYSQAVSECPEDIILLFHQLRAFQPSDREHPVLRHLNLLVVNKKEHLVYNFEPHGVAEWTAVVEAHVRSHIMPKTLGLDSSYTFVSTTLLCPSRRGPQRRDARDSGFCGGWVSWFGVVCLLNPDHSSEEVLNELLRDGHDLNDDVRRWVAFMEHCVHQTDDTEDAWGDDLTWWKCARALQDNTLPLRTETDRYFSNVNPTKRGTQ